MPITLSDTKERYSEDQERLLESEVNRPNSRHGKPKVPRRNFFLWASFALANICIGLLLGYWCVRYSGLSITRWGINPNSPVPKEILTRRSDVAFSPDRRYMGPGKEVNKNWLKLTKSSDSVYLPNPSAYGLHDAGIRAPFFIFSEPPESAKSLSNINSFYVLNTLHQLHCVDVVRKRYNMLVYEQNTTNPLGSNPSDEDWIEHVEHCIEYLRLSVTCADYMTLETDSPPGSPPEFYEGGLSWGVVHSCIDWQGLMKWQHDQVILYNSTWSEL